MLKETRREPRSNAPSAGPTPLSGPHRKTLEAIFRHPSAHDIEWTDLVQLMESIGEVEKKDNGEFMFKVRGERHVAHKPHTKDLTGLVVIELRKFLTRVGFPGAAPDSATPKSAPQSTLMVVVDHHEAKVYPVGAGFDQASSRGIAPYDPHHFLHHLTHKDQSREQGQRAPEEGSFYRDIAKALAGEGPIIVVGHGKGKSNAAHHLTDYLRDHDQATFLRIAHQLDVDLSSVTTPELVAMAKKAMLSAAV